MAPVGWSVDDQISVVEAIALFDDRNRVCVALVGDGGYFRFASLPDAFHDLTVSVEDGVLIVLAEIRRVLFDLVFVDTWEAFPDLFRRYQTKVIERDGERFRHLGGGFCCAVIGRVLLVETPDGGRLAGAV
jgi:hypothetical protein